MANTVTVKLRGLEYTSELTNSDGIFFLSLIFNKEERDLAEQGKLEEASTKYGDRMKKRLGKAKNDQQRQSIVEEADKEMTIAVFQLIERDKKVRSQVAWRLREIFPDLPENLVYYHDELKNGIRLDVEETMTLFLNIIAPTLTNMVKKEEKVKVVEVEPDRVVEIQNSLPDREARLAELKAKIAELENA